MSKKKLNIFTGNFDFVGQSTNAQTDLNYIATENISALQLVYADSPTTVSVAKSTLAFKPFGIAITSALAGNQLTVKPFGEVSDVSFAFTYGQALFLNQFGFVTNVPVLTGYHIKVATGMGAGKIFLDIDDLILLN